MGDHGNAFRMGRREWLLSTGSRAVRAPYPVKAAVDILASLSTQHSNEWSSNIG